MIDFTRHEDNLIMRYQPERNEAWLVEPLQRDEDIPLSSRTFFVRREIYRTDIEDGDYVMDACYRFIVGQLEGDYYRMDRRFLGIEYDLFMHQSLTFKRKTFVAETNLAIFRGFNIYGFEELWIGGDRPDALPKSVFQEMLDQFPTTWELKRYANARVSSIIRNYVPHEADFEEKYRSYMKRKQSRQGFQPLEVFSDYEAEKYSDLLEKLKVMLAQADGYTEAQWQAEIIQIIQLLYPKYIHAIPEAPVRDSLASKDRKIDFMLVDASGYVDAVELKKPFAECIVTNNRYRDNHVPMRELNGTVMQLEKYLYHLNRWGQQGEKKLNERFGDQLPEGVAIKVVNPGGMIIMGRDKDLTEDQLNDFEVIRRKYRHVLEIMTYDDMLRRLEVIRNQLKRDADNG